jgi:nitrite reductase/ring-hydroxylating ferredoxin subunit
MAGEPLKRNLFQRILGLCATPPPRDPGCWRLENGRVVVDLARAPELAAPDGGLRLEGAGLSQRILVVRGGDGTYRAFRNRCTHAGRRLDPMPGEGRVQCCSVGKSTFDAAGRRVSGSAKKDLPTFPVAVEGDRLVIAL